MIYETVTRHTISILPPGHKRRRYYQINVTMIGTDWIIEHLGEWYHRGGEWVPPMSTSFVDCAFAGETEALETARHLAPGVQGGNGRAALDVLNEQDTRA